MLYLQNHSFLLQIICGIGKIILLADSPFDLYYWVYIRHDFSLGSNFHKVPYETVVELIFTKKNLYFLAWALAGVVAQ